MVYSSLENFESCCKSYYKTQRYFLKPRSIMAFSFKSDQENSFGSCWNWQVNPVIAPFILIVDLIRVI